MDFIQGRVPNLTGDNILAILPQSNDVYNSVFKLNTFTITLWVYATAPVNDTNRTNTRVLSSSIGDESGFILRSKSDSDEVWEFVVYKPNGRVYTAKTSIDVEYGVWTHIALTFDNTISSYQKIYINGKNIILE